MTTKRKGFARTVTPEQRTTVIKHHAAGESIRAAAAAASVGYTTAHRILVEAEVDRSRTRTKPTN